MPFPIRIALPETILAPVPEAGVEQAPTPNQAPAGPKTYALIKNQNTHEDIKLLDGSTFRFVSAEFVTTDEVLYQKLLEVADRHFIVKRDLD